jgi:hypothetical protein
MKIAIMQPYFFPYIGYLRLISSVDQFVVYDNIQYTKKGWINRNRILLNGKDKMITVPLKKDSDYLNIKERSLSGGWKKDRSKLLNTIKSAYAKAPYFGESFPLIEECLLLAENNLFKFLLNSLKKLCAYLEINTKFITSSSVNIDHSLKSESRVLAICKNLECDVYINPIGGQHLYDYNNFKQEGITLKFMRPETLKYSQYSNCFIPALSIIDVLMFNGKKETTSYLNKN